MVTNIEPHYCSLGKNYCAKKSGLEETLLLPMENIMQHKWQRKKRGTRKFISKMLQYHKHIPLTTVPLSPKHIQ